MTTAMTALGWSGPGPVVVWRRDLDCAAGQGWTTADGRCIRGRQDGAVIQVAIWPGAVAPQTSLAHEAAHYVLWRTTGDSRADHRGSFYDEVAAANQRLWDLIDAGSAR